LFSLSLSLSLSLYFLEREALHPFFKILCFPPLSPPSVAVPGEEGRALSLQLFPPPFLFSSFLTSSLSLCLCGFLGFIYFLGVVLGGWVFSGMFLSLPLMPFPWLADELLCMGFGSFASWVVDLLCLGPPTSARASPVVSPSCSGFPCRWHCCGWTPCVVPARMAEGVF